MVEQLGNPQFSISLEDSLPNILILTATIIETRAVLNTFCDEKGQKWIRNAFEDKFYYRLGAIGGAMVFLAQSETGTVTPAGAFVTAVSMIDLLNIQAIIMCGIAFGLRTEKQDLGDILISKQLVNYEIVKLDKIQGTLLRGDRITASDSLLRRCRSAVLDWEGATLHFGLMLSGEKLVNDPDFRGWLLRNEQEAIGGEMEGAGLYLAARNAKVEWILVKAICDWADGNKNDGAQELAAKNAANFVFHAIQLGGWSVSSSFSYLALPQFKHLIKELMEWKELHDRLNSILTSYGSLNVIIKLPNGEHAKINDIKLAWSSISQMMNDLLGWATNEIEIIEKVAINQDNKTINGPIWATDLWKYKEKIEKKLDSGEKLENIWRCRSMYHWIRNHNLYDEDREEIWHESFSNMIILLYGCVKDHLQSVDGKLKKTVEKLSENSRINLRG